MLQKSNSNPFKIRLVSIRKVEEKEIVLSDNKINLIWLSRGKNQLKAMEKIIKRQLKDKIKLIKCSKLETIKSLKLSLTEQPCLVLINQVYEKSLLNYFHNQKVILMVYNDNLEGICQDMNCSKIYFMSQKQEYLIEYIKTYVERINQTGSQIGRRKKEILDQEAKRIAEQITIQDRNANKRHLPKIHLISPKKQQISIKQFMNSNCEYPGPGYYNLSNTTKWTRKTNDRDEISLKITQQRITEFSSSLPKCV